MNKLWWAFDEYSASWGRINLRVYMEATKLYYIQLLNILEEYKKLYT